MRGFPIQSELNRAKLERERVVERLPYMEIPWEMIAPHEAQSQANHYQTLERIAQRGGFSRCEAIAVIEDRNWHRMTAEEADTNLKSMVKKWEDKQRCSSPA